MAKRTRTEVLEGIRSLLGDRTDDESLALLEDIGDSWPEGAEEDWKAKYDALDADWRKRYRDRFFSAENPAEVETEETGLEAEESQATTYDDLFREE